MVCNDHVSVMMEAVKTRQVVESVDKKLDRVHRETFGNGNSSGSLVGRVAKVEKALSINNWLTTMTLGALIVNVVKGMI